MELQPSMTHNSIDTNISFTLTHWFLKTIGQFLWDVYRKPTHTNRYLDFNSHHNKKHNVSTGATLLHLKGKNTNLIMFT